MKIVVIGDGKVGFVLTKQLSQEGHDVVVIDRQPNVLRTLQEKIDVAVITGNGASVEIQRQAGVPSADLLIAATSSDEVNLLCGLVAHKLGCKNTIARVRNPEYDEQMSLLKKDFGLSFTVNPEKSAAREIYRLLQYPSFLKRDSFAGGRAEIVEIKLTEGSKLIGRRLDKLGDLIKVSSLICTVERGGKAFIPSGSFELSKDDKLSVAVATTELRTLIQQYGIKTPRIGRVLIIGGSRVAAYLAKLLIDAKVSVSIIEKDMNRCEELYEMLPTAQIINGDGTSQELLIDEGIAEAEAIVTLTGRDEDNLLVSMFANSQGVRKTITKINRLEYTDVFSNMGIDTIVSPKLLTANEIVRYVRSVGASRTGGVETLYRIAGSKAEALGFTVPEKGAFLGVPFYKLQLKPNILIASIVRHRKVIIPKGNDYLSAGDSIVVIANSERAIADLSDIFADGEAKSR